MSHFSYVIRDIFTRLPSLPTSRVGHGWYYLDIIPSFIENAGRRSALHGVTPPLHDELFSSGQKTKNAKGGVFHCVVQIGTTFLAQGYPHSMYVDHGWYNISEATIKSQNMPEQNLR